MWWAAGEPRAHRGRSGGTQGTRGGGGGGSGRPAPGGQACCAAGSRSRGACVMHRVHVLWSVR